MATPGPSYTEAEARAAIAASLSYAEALRRLGLRSAGGNWRTLKRYVTEVWRIPVGHFDPSAGQRAALGRGRIPARPLEELLTEHSRCSRGNLKRRLYDAGLKPRRCELCGQGEEWRGRRMALILDHINGRGGRQPPGEPQDRLPELCRDARYPLRRQRPRPPRLRGLRADVPQP